MAGLVATPAWGAAADIAVEIDLNGQCAPPLQFSDIVRQDRSKLAR
jgi:hypothetical protein